MPEKDLFRCADCCRVFEDSDGVCPDCGSENVGIMDEDDDAQQEASHYAARW